MRVLFHDSKVVNARGGALRYYAEISQLLRQHAGAELRPQPHDFFSIASGPVQELQRVVEGLEAEDVVVSSVGPYAHLYHYVRELCGGRFRIIRDVRTSSWAGYLLQECLAGPLTRPGDIVLFPSEFCRRYFVTHFADLGPHNTRVCYPLGTLFPDPETRPRRDHLRVGYLGRISPDKNFQQVLSIFARLRKEGEPTARLHLAGPFESQIWSRLGEPKLVRTAKALGIPRSSIRYAGNLAAADVWQYLRGVDVLLFPALASVESMGRVILEAARVGTAVVAAEYAAAPELICPENLVRSCYQIHQQFSTLAPFSFGAICEDEAAAAVLRARVGSDPSSRPHYQWSSFVDVLRGESPAARAVRLHPTVEAFVRSLQFEGLPFVDGECVMPLLAQAWRHFGEYNDNRLGRRFSLAFGTRARRLGVEKSLRQMRLLSPGSRMVLSHARAHCRFLGVDPKIALRPSPGDGARLVPRDKTAEVQETSRAPSGASRLVDESRSASRRR